MAVQVRGLGRVVGGGRKRSLRVLVRSGVALLALGQLGGCALVASDWHSQDARRMQMVVSGMVVVDGLQTAQFARSPECTRERNPLAFGGDPHPSVEKVVSHQLLYWAAHWLTGKWLDQRYGVNGGPMQKWYWGLTLGGHGLAIGNNVREGISPLRKYECE